MSHRARRQLAPSPDAIADRVAAHVGAAFERWAQRFLRLVLSDFVPTKFRADATLQGLFEEAGHADPERRLLEEAFRGLDRQSADEVRVAGVRTADVVPGGPALQQRWVRQNTDLIKAEADLRRRVERVISDPLNAGRSVADISKLLQEQAGYAKSRAELTARDQTLKLYGQIQQERQTNAGITHYIWTTSLDERVREDHAALDGTTQAWDDPPIVDQRTGRTGHPGSDFQCRCTSVPVLPEFEDDDTPVPSDTGAVAPPPREPAMFPAPGEAEARAAERAALTERRRLEAEAEADLRIARAAEQRRVEVPPAVAPFTPTELVARAESVAVERGTKRAAQSQITEAVESAVRGKSLRELGALDDPNSLRPDSFRFLRQDPTFRQTGNLLDVFASGAGGLPSIGIEPGGRTFLQNGRHRLTVARELGLRQIVARVIKYNTRGDIVWTYVGPVLV
jgi:SPP1 gp7 family putative phage head morphogenesis protein